MKSDMTPRNSSVVIIIIMLFQEPSAFPLAAVALAAEPVPLSPLPHSPCCCRCCRCYCRPRQCRRFCSSAVSLPAACVCVRVICASSVHTDVSCLTFGLRLNSLSLTGDPPPAHPLPPQPTRHRGLSPTAACPSPCRRARSSSSVGYRAALRPSPSPTRPLPPLTPASAICIDGCRLSASAGGGVCRREIQTGANQCRTHQ